MTERAQTAVVLLGVLLLVAMVTGAEDAAADAGDRQNRAVPNWALTSSDFFGWVEELRQNGGYEQIQELARTFWAHFPSADRLGYGVRDQD
ncbi:otospiralin-like isoform 2-T4 [Menidia menidia]